MVLISPVLCFLLALLLSGTLGNDAVKSRSKRALSSNRRQSTAQSIQELVFQLGKKHLFQVISGKKDDVENPRESVFILQRDSCSKIMMIGKPVTHNSNYKTQGAWMKDPLGIMGTETIFVMAGYSGRNVVEEFENMGMFKAGVTRKTYSLPY
ncbi:Olfactomedin-like [Porites harrisoni]